MKQVSIVLMFAIALLGLSAFQGGEAYACSCVGGDAKAKLERSNLVFLGKVIEIGDVNKDSSKMPERRYVFEVEKSWKGAPDHQVTLYSYDGAEASCGYKFDLNQTYLVYTYQEEGSDKTPRTNLCSGNLLQTEADEDIKLLGDGVVPTSAVAKTIDPTSGEKAAVGTPNSYLALYGVAVLVLVVFVGLTMKRKRRK